METLTPAQRVIVIAIGLALTALIAMVLLPWLNQEINERLPDTPTPLPTSTPTRPQPTKAPTLRPTTTPTRAESTATPSPGPSTTVTSPQTTTTPTPFRTQGLNPDAPDRPV